MINTSSGIISLILFLTKEFKSKKIAILPFSPGFFIEISNKFIFNLISINQMSLIFIGGLLNVSYNMIFFNMMMIICCQVKLLKHRYKIVAKNMEIYKNDEENIEDKIYMEKKIMTNFVNNHLKVVGLSKNICNIFSTVIFMQYVYSTFLICIPAYISSNAVFLSAEFFSQIMVLGLGAMQISIICYASNEMKNQV